VRAALAYFQLAVLQVAQKHALFRPPPAQESGKFLFTRTARLCFRHLLFRRVTHNTASSEKTLFMHGNLKTRHSTVHRVYKGVHINSTQDIQHK
jgi:hypothetical protein